MKQGYAEDRVSYMYILEVNTDFVDGPQVFAFNPFTIHYTLNQTATRSFYWTMNLIFINSEGRSVNSELFLLLLHRALIFTHRMVLV